jgi:diphthine-ammonia ligase
MQFQAGERVFISGQIGLIPSELVIPSPRSFSSEFALASQHVARVTTALQENSGGGWDGHSQLTINWLVDSDDLTRCKIGHHALQVCFHHNMLAFNVRSSFHRLHRLLHYF